MLNALINFAITPIEAMCCLIFFKGFCDPSRQVEKKKRIPLVILLILLSYCVVSLFQNWLLMKILLVALVFLLVMKQYFQISLKHSILLTSLYMGVLYTADYLTVILLYLISHATDIPIETNYSLQGGIIILAKSILFLLMLIIRRVFSKKPTDRVIEREWHTYILFPIFTIIVQILLLYTFNDLQKIMESNLLYAIALGMLGISIFFYYLINHIAQQESDLREKELLELQVQGQLDMYRSVLANYEQQKRKSHEFKNHILCIQGLLRDENYAKASSYVNSISEKLVQEKNAFDTGHPIFNAILNTKYQEAVEKRIHFISQIDHLSLLKMEDEDVVVLLANLLNNAIEACEKCEGRKEIKLRLLCKEDSFLLSLKNTYIESPLWVNNEIKTSKKIREEEHGVGIKNILRIVEKYQGDYAIQYANGEFLFSILLPLR